MKECGLEVVEWGGDVHVPHGDMERARMVGAMTRDAGLSVIAYGSYYRAGQSDQDGLPFERVLETAVALDAPRIRVWPGTRGSEETDPSHRRWVVEELQRISGLAAQAGREVVLEFHSRTLTDTNESAVRLLDEVGHRSCRTLWQPPNGKQADHCLAGLRAVLPRTAHVHAFHWWPDSGLRHALADGWERWSRYLEVLATDAADHDVLLEFVKGDEPGQLRADAATLRGWLDDARRD